MSPAEIIPIVRDGRTFVATDDLGTGCDGCAFSYCSACLVPDNWDCLTFGIIWKKQEQE